MNMYRCGGKPEQEKSVTPSAEAQTILPDLGKTLKKVSVNGDSDLIPANIKQGVNIFGVDGELLEEQVTIDGVKVKEKLDLSAKTINVALDSIPMDGLSSNVRPVVLNDEIHVLYQTTHYKIDGSSWTSVSTLPYSTIGGSAVVLNNEIHLLFDGNNKYHYKWDGSSWTKVSTLPYVFNGGDAVVLNNEIHILGGSENVTTYTYHYKWNGRSWTKVSTLPYRFYSTRGAVVLNNEIHIMGSSESNCQKNHYKWNGSSWTSVSTLPYNFYSSGTAIVLNNKIHLVSGYDYDGYGRYHYIRDGSKWVNAGLLPDKFDSGAICAKGSNIFLAGGHNNGKNNYSTMLMYVNCYTEV